MYPILHLYDVNADEVRFADVWPSLLKAAGAAAVIWFLVWLLRREPRRAGIVASLLVALYFYYFTYSGWIFQIVMVALAANWLIFLLYKSESDFRAFAAALNVMSVVIVGTATWGIVSTLMNPPAIVSEIELEPLTEEQQAMVGTTPNLYFIIMDGYGGQDVLERYYRTNNDEFISFLRDQGFWVAEHSRSNYLRTSLSLPATLNMEYLDEFIETHNLAMEEDPRPVLGRMKKSRVRLFLEQFGYTSVGISSGFTGWDMFGVEHFVDYKIAGANEFQSIVNQHTPAYPITVELAVMDPFSKHRELQFSAIDTFPEFPNMFPEHPIAGFIHIMSPHPPFVFERDGSPAEQKSPLFNLGDGDYLVDVTMDRIEYQVAYANQLKYTNELMTEAIAQLRQNDPEAIIVLQGDHGPGSGYHGSDPFKNDFIERSSILNAVYLPNQDYNDFYDTMTPVNTFRIIFNHYFGTDYEYLPDETYFSMTYAPYDLYRVNFAEEEQAADGSVEAQASPEE